MPSIFGSVAPAILTRHDLGPRPRQRIPVGVEHQPTKLPLRPSATHGLDTFLVALDRVLADRQFRAVDLGQSSGRARDRNASMRSSCAIGLSVLFNWLKTGHLRRARPRSTSETFPRERFCPLVSGSTGLGQRPRCSGPPPGGSGSEHRAAGYLPTAELAVICLRPTVSPTPPWSRSGRSGPSAPPSRLSAGHRRR